MINEFDIYDSFDSTPYMVNRMLDSLYLNNNSFFRRALSNNLPTDITLIINLNGRIENYDYNVYDTEHEYYFNLRCYVKNFNSVNYENNNCECIDNLDCKIEIVKEDEYKFPAINYIGNNHIKCNCSQNICNNLCNDWEYIYNLQLKYKYIFIQVMDDFGYINDYYISLDNGIKVIIEHGYRSIP